MDYRSEVTALNGQLEAGTMNACEIALWHALHDIGILCGHSDELSVATVTLTVRTGFSASSIKRARDALRDKGYITFRSRGSNRAALYGLVSAVHREPQDEPQRGLRDEPRDGPFYTSSTTLENTEDVYKSAHREPQDEPQREPQPWMTDEECAKASATLDAVFDLMARIGMPCTAHDLDTANLLAADYTAEWVLEALRRAGDSNREARSWRFVRGILRNWREKGGIDSGEKPKAPAAPKVKFADFSGME